MKTTMSVTSEVFIRLKAWRTKVEDDAGANVSWSLIMDGFLKKEGY